MRKPLILGAAMLVGSALHAQLIGDVDCFGTVFGVQPVCANTYAIPGIPTDGRSPAEVAATNGAQQTDYYSAGFAPLPEVFTLRWNLVGPLAAGASVTYRAYGLQATEFGPFITRFNGVAETGFLNFQDGATAVVTRTIALSAGAISRANMAGFLAIEISRSGNTDAVAFDYFNLTGAQNVVPEPSTYALLATGLAGLAALRRRRRA